MSSVGYALIMLAAGIGVPVLAALNAQLGARMGSPAAAAMIVFAVAFCCATVVTVLTSPSALARAIGQPPHLFLAGALIAFYLLSITYIAPKFGIGNAIMFVLIGQFIAAAGIDHFGLFGAMVKPLSLQRAGGILVMVCGLTLAMRA